MISRELVLPKLDRFWRNDLLQMLKSKGFPYEKLQALKHAGHLSSRLWPVPAAGEAGGTGPGGLTLCVPGHITDSKLPCSHCHINLIQSNQKGRLEECIVSPA